MSETLTQEEIDALRDAVKSGSIEEEAVATHSDDADIEQVKVVSYDFRKPQLISTEQLHTLQMLHETAAKSLQSMLVSFLKATPDIRLVAMDQISYSEFVLSMTNPTYVVGMMLEPEMGRVALELAAPIGAALLDILLGGDGQQAKDNDSREFSALEMDIMRRLTERIVEELSLLWKPVFDVQYKLYSEESNPEYLQMQAPDTPCLCATFDIHIGEIDGVMNVCYPFVTLQNVLKKGEEKKAEIPGERAGDRQSIMRAVENVSLPSCVVIGKTSVSARDLCSLETGDVLLLDKQVGKSFSFEIAGRKAYVVDAGTCRGRLAVCLKQNPGADAKS